MLRQAMAELEAADGSWWTCSICGDIHQGESNAERQARLVAMQERGSAANE